MSGDGKPPIARLLEYYGAHQVPEGSRWRKMKCPFHEDRNASASVDTTKQLFRCFSCAEGGDAYDIASWREGFKDFPSAREFIERILGESYGNVSPGIDGKPGQRKRRGVFEEQGPISGQRSILQIRKRRKPLTGT